MMLKYALVGGSCLLLGYGLGAAFGGHPRVAGPGASPADPVGGASPAGRDSAAGHGELAEERFLARAPLPAAAEGAEDRQEGEAVPSAVAHRSPYTDWLTDEELEAAFGDLSEPELIGLEKGLELVLHADAGVFLDELFERGLYQTQILSPGEMREIPVQAEDGGLMSSRIMDIPREDGTIERRLASVRLSDHPNLEARDRQLLWVRTKLQVFEERRKAASGR